MMAREFSCLSHMNSDDPAYTRTSFSTPTNFTTKELEGAAVVDAVRMKCKDDGPSLSFQFIQGDAGTTRPTLNRPHQPTGELYFCRDLPHFTGLP